MVLYLTLVVALLLCHPRHHHSSDYSSSTPLLHAAESLLWSLLERLELQGEARQLHQSIIQVG